MTLEQTLTATVEQAVRRAVEPLRQELEKLRAEQHAEAISVTEAARRLGVSARTIQRMIRRGELPSVRVGGARRVQIHSLLSSPSEVPGLAGRSREE
jgi:excisionase family DNA binding protein